MKASIEDLVPADLQARARDALQRRNTTRVTNLLTRLRNKQGTIRALTALNLELKTQLVEERSYRRSLQELHHDT